MNSYAGYQLRDNPFPATPIIDPNSPDDRINGRVYNPAIMGAAIQSFESKIQRRPPLIYIESSEFERGEGKSALTARHWRALQQEEGITSVYIRSETGWKPADFAMRIIERWHEKGDLWKALLRIMHDYTRERPHSAIPIDGADKFIESLPSMPLRQISLSNYMVFNTDRAIGELAQWAVSRVGGSLPLDLAQAYFQSYLTDPRTFPDIYGKVLRKRKADTVSMLGAVYRILGLGGYQFHYLFFDQFEDVVHGLSGKPLIAFSTGMRRLIEASLGKATIVVTLHPGAANTLNTNEAGDITSLAPLDERHVVYVLPLAEDGAAELARTYLDHFRLPGTAVPDAIYPFTLDTIRAIHAAAQGRIRACLLAFNYAIEEGVNAGFAVLDGDFVAKHHRQITGLIHKDEENLGMK